MLEPFDAVEGLGGLGSDHLNGGIEGFEAAASTHHGAAGADRSDKMGHAPARLLPDFGRSSISVGVPIGGIVVLVGLEIAIWIGFVHLPRLQNRAVG